VTFCQDNKNESRSINSNIVNIELEENSKVNYINLQNDSNLSISLFNLFVKQSHNSNFYLNNVSLGNDFAFNNAQFIQHGNANQLVLDWVNICTGNQKIYDIINVYHYGNHNHSIENFRGIYFHNSSRVLDNLVSVKKNSENIKSHQLSENLIVSKNAYVKVLPSMKIYSDNIKCTHGVVIDKLSKNSLFYMCSRGISQKIANKIIIISFIKNLIDNIENIIIKKEAWRNIKYKLQSTLL